jgi:putative transposase
MTRYRRDHTPGATWFFTVNLADRRQRLLVERIAVLRAAFASVRERHPFKIESIVVLPDHLHAIWTLPADDADYPLRWRLIKAAFSRGLDAGEPRSRSRASAGERGVWQRRYWEHRIRDETDFMRHVDYIHFNPVKHGHVACVVDWPWSSFHRYVRRGVLPPGWAGDASDANNFGERK